MGISIKKANVEKHQKSDWKKYVKEKITRKIEEELIRNLIFIQDMIHKTDNIPFIIFSYKISFFMKKSFS